MIGSFVSMKAWMTLQLQTKHEINTNLQHIYWCYIKGCMLVMTADILSNSNIVKIFPVGKYWIATGLGHFPLIKTAYKMRSYIISARQEVSQTGDDSIFHCRCCTWTYKELKYKATHNQGVILKEYVIGKGHVTSWICNRYRSCDLFADFLIPSRHFAILNK